MRMCSVLKRAVQIECIYTGVCCRLWGKASSVPGDVLSADGCLIVGTQGNSCECALILGACGL